MRNGSLAVQLINEAAITEEASLITIEAFRSQYHQLSDLTRARLLQFTFNQLNDSIAKYDMPIEDPADMASERHVDYHRRKAYLAGLCTRYRRVERCLNTLTPDRVCA